MPSENLNVPQANEDTILAMPQVEWDHFLFVCSVIFLGGALGGLIEFIRALSLKDANTSDQQLESFGCLYYNGVRISKGMCIWFAFFGACIGSISAIALQFILVLLDASKFDVSVDASIFNLSISAAVGFGGRRMLPKMSDKIQNSFIDSEARSNAEKATETAEIASESAQVASLYSRVQDAMKDDAIPSTTSQTIYQLTKRLEKTPLNRQYNIWLARLFIKQKKFEQALQCIDRFLSQKSAMEEFDKDYADLSFNKACYLSQEFGRTDNSEIKASAIEALREAIKWSSENSADAINDSDFEPIRSAPEFMEIVGGSE